MRASGIVVRLLLEVVSLLVGGLMLALGILLAVYAIATPECSVDPDDARAVLVHRTSLAVWVASQLGWAIVAGRAFGRSAGGWGRVVIAAMVPVGLVILWIVWSGAAQLLLDLVDAGDASASCW